MRYFRDASGANKNVVRVDEPVNGMRPSWLINTRGQMTQQHGAGDAVMHLVENGKWVELTAEEQLELEQAMLTARDHHAEAIAQADERYNKLVADRLIENGKHADEVKELKRLLAQAQAAAADAQTKLAKITDAMK